MIAQDAQTEETGAAPDQAKLLYEAGGRAAMAMFVDAHNTAYYINAYTTKVNPSMDSVFEKLLARGCGV